MNWNRFHWLFKARDCKKQVTWPEPLQKKPGLDSKRVAMGRGREGDWFVLCSNSRAYDSLTCKKPQVAYLWQIRGLKFLICFWTLLLFLVFYSTPPHPTHPSLPRRYLCASVRDLSFPVRNKVRTEYVTSQLRGKTRFFWSTPKTAILHVT